MSADTLSTTDMVVKGDVNPSMTTSEQTELSMNGVSYSENQINNDNAPESSTEGQNGSTQNNYDTNDNTSTNKSDLEPETLRKVFIGGLSYKTDDQTFRDYFSKFGEIDVSKNQ